MDQIVDGDGSAQLTTQELEDLVNIQAEFERYDSIESTVITTVDNEPTAHEEIIVQHQEEEVSEQQSLIDSVEPISTSFLSTSSMGVLNVVNTDGMSYEVIEQVSDHQSEQTLSHFLEEDDAIASSSEVIIGDSSEVDHCIDQTLDEERLQFGIPEVPSAMSIGTPCVDVTSTGCLPSNVVATVETFAALTGSTATLDSSAFTFLSSVPMDSTVAAVASTTVTGRSTVTYSPAVKTEPQVTIGTHDLTAISDDSVGASFTAVQTVKVAPSSILDRTTITSTNTTNFPKVSRPIYLVSNSSGTLSMTTVAPTIVTTKSSSDSSLNKVVFTATNPLASAGHKIQPLGRSLNAIQSRVVPTLVRTTSHNQMTSGTVSTASVGVNNEVFTKVIFTNNGGSGTTTGLTLSPAQTNAFLAGLPQQMKIVTSTQSQAIIGHNSLSQTTLTSPAKQPQQQRLLTSVPGSPSKQSFLLGKYAVASQTPTTITMIPVTISKTPAKIAPAGSNIVAKGGVCTMTTATSPRPTTTTTAAVSPKFILKQVAMKPGQVLGTVSLPSSSTTTTMVSSVNSSSTISQTIQANKLSYIRLVPSTVASPTAVVTASSTLSSPLSSNVNVVKSHQMIGTISSNRPVAAVTTTTATTFGSCLPTRQLSSVGQQSTIPQMKIAVPIQPVGQTLPTLTISGQQRILIPASAMGNIAQLRPTTAVAGTPGTITLPASALANLPPGTTFFSPGSNIMMVPAQYVTQFQQQQQQQKLPVHNKQTVMVSAPSVVRPTISPIVASSTVASMVSQAQASITPTPILPQPVAISLAPISSGGILKHQLPTTSSISTFLNERTVSKHQVNGRTSQDSNGVRPRKPCNCTKSQCLKLYCDCFANGEFCHECNCNNCFNNLEHEEDRQKAIKSCLERNPQAFHPKIDISFATKAKDGDIERRHNKGCNCKRSGCLKNYCECYEAKIMCSYMCKCVGCKNVEETADKKTLMHLADAAEVRVQQQAAARNKLSSQMMDAASVAVASKLNLGPTSGDKIFSSFITADVVEATCQCMLAQAVEGRRENQSDVHVEVLIVREFGRCLQQIIEYANKTKP